MISQYSLQWIHFTNICIFLEKHFVKKISANTLTVMYIVIFVAIELSYSASYSYSQLKICAQGTGYVFIYFHCILFPYGTFSMIFERIKRDYQIYSSKEIMFRKEREQFNGLKTLFNGLFAHIYEANMKNPCSSSLNVSSALYINNRHCFLKRK